MALIWADFPSEQYGLYGLSESAMLAGVWAAFEGAFASSMISISTDVDPAIGSRGNVLRFAQSGSTGTWSLVAARLTYPAAVVTAGVGFRLWINEYPEGDSAAGNTGWSFRSTSNALVARFKIGASGQILVYNAAGTLVHTSDPAIVLAQAYNHIETKCVRDNVNGEIEIRINGIPKVTLSSLVLGNNNIANVALEQNTRDDGLGGSIPAYFKDMVFWDGEGDDINDFVGSVFVHDLFPDADDDLNWDPSRGSTGFNLIDDFYPSATLTASGSIIDGTVLEIDDVYYRWSTGSLDSSSPAGTSANPWRVLLGADTETALLNMFKAINASGVAGTNYSTALTEHPSIDACGSSATLLTVEAHDMINNDFDLTENGGSTAWSAITGGPVDLDYISADNTLPPESIFTLTDLPEDVISVKAVMPMGRLLKTDGGDATIQMGVSPNGTDWFDGEDRPITVAATYYHDVSYKSPDTDAAWTPTEVNDMVFRVDRTT